MPNQPYYVSGPTPEGRIVASYDYNFSNGGGLNQDTSEYYVIILWHGMKDEAKETTSCKFTQARQSSTNEIIFVWFYIEIKNVQNNIKFNDLKLYKAF